MSRKCLRCLMWLKSHVVLDMEEGDCPVEIGEFFHYAVGLDVPESAPAVSNYVSTIY